MDTRFNPIDYKGMAERLSAGETHQALRAESAERLAAALPEGGLRIPVGSDAQTPAPEPVLLPSTIVLFYPPPQDRRGAPYMPAFVTRVWGKGAHPVVNLVAFGEDGETLVFTSVEHASVRSELSKAEDGRYWAYRNQ